VTTLERSVRFDLEIDIERPPEAVFPWISDRERAMQWMTSVAGGEIVHETPDKVGTTFRERVEEGGRGTELTGEITEFTQNKSMAFHLDGDYNRVDISYEVRPRSGGSRLIFRSDVRFKSLTRILMLVVGFAFRRKISRQLHSELATLKRLCEGEA
jgi:uncharacterized protein YndB with AHSA1/START domain